MRFKKFPFFVAIFQTAFLVLFAVFGRYGKEADAKADAKAQEDGDRLADYYPMFQDVHVMIFVGFGFLMTFLKRYGYSSVGINFLIGAFVLQWATLMIGFFGSLPTTGYIDINIYTMLSADFAAAAVLISFGAVLGKLSPLQLLIMTFIEVVLFQLNEHIGREYLHALDAGDSMFVHMFGAYFGLAVARVTFHRDVEKSTKEEAVYHSDLFAMVGTVFLWIFWPSFNAGALAGDDRHRAVINTYYSIAACCVFTFAISSLVDKKNKLDMVHIQNSTLAGGVAVGACGNMMIQPWGAILIGMVAGSLSVVGYKFLTPMMNSKLKIHDTCGVHNLHGMPAILAAFASAVASAIASKEVYGDGLYDTFPALAPVTNVTGGHGEHGGMGWTSGIQAGHQMAAMGVTLCIAIIGGTTTGFLLRIPVFDAPRNNQIFDDDQFWEVPEPEIVMHPSDNNQERQPLDVSKM
ncbi:PREDICTED: ammonium transporter Rh type B-B-like isoform X2 [Priapulus caudatus]|uniref:Ammonium transporter Rh type B-B-like isoform X2 n=1 Tax=Priapulus caudatus TaxID=37621 RepID=A0ABM1EJD8_PRICU|nr:PREDICTED: ammonium transporter Rh type B-B-like isoform X2 [Priapulus caudatus]